MNEITRSLGAQELQASLEAWFNTHVLALDNAIQVGLIILALLIGRLLGARLRRVIGSASEHRPWRTDVHTVVARIAVLSTPITMLVFL